MKNYYFKMSRFKNLAGSVFGIMAFLVGLLLAGGIIFLPAVFEDGSGGEIFTLYFFTFVMVFGFGFCGIICSILVEKK